VVEARRLRVVWPPLLVASALAAVMGCSEPTQAGSDATGATVTKPVSAEDGPPPPSETTATGTGTDRAADVAPISEPAPSAESDCSPEPAGAYPLDAPDYPSSVIVEDCLESDGRIRRVATTPDTGEQVYVYMTHALEARGWAIQSKLAQGGQFALDAIQANRRAAVLIADRDIVEPRDGQTRITVLITP
jgi:hypothetical protein